MLITYTDLINNVVNQGVLEGVDDLDRVNGSSIDITLGTDLLVEEFPDLTCPKCDTSFYGRIDPSWSERTAADLIFCKECRQTSHAHRWFAPVDFSKKQPLKMSTHSCEGEGYVLWPGEVCLAHSAEKFNLPTDITAEYRLKSSMGRVFLEHLHAGWCDPGWHGSVLTLEFKNESQYHPLVLRAGMKCGQVCFYKHDPVPEDNSYAKRGQYNNDETVTPTKGMR